VGRELDTYLDVANECTALLDSSKSFDLRRDTIVTYASMFNMMTIMLVLTSRRLYGGPTDLAKGITLY
jgi:hypothetical protein